MAIVDLGTQPLFVGGSPTAYAGFPYDATTAIGIGIVFSSPNFSNIFSRIQLRVSLISSGLPVFIDAQPYNIDVLNVIQIQLIPFSPLYFGNGTCILIAERIPFWRGAGDGTPLSMNLLYDDAVTVPSWRA